jgi:hypothetical protein
MDQTLLPPAARRHRLPFASSPRLLFVLVALVIALAASASAQAPCPAFGGHATPATIDPSPAPLGCTGASQWPQWHLWTPAHDAPGPKPGFTPGDARPRTRWLVRYRCTGWLLVPVLPLPPRAMGYVVDQPDRACAGG